ncbi:uncharacterized protein LTR77_003341 [Saxophila tyrrhenica]|uniref:Xylanolytic transcriptional activator regulatory domain-containing protein n=1 Tax=Saxophila tyrrhenica TaxID=1690608 RepID=A0AAV9PDE9_9PEZI|nr:hypothetical protein LTR77_003341 [Saxophila tyrrhenica]
MITPNATAGPKGSRAKVISELREAQRKSHVPASRDDREASAGFDSFTRTSGLLPPELIATCTDFFFTNMYGTMPIVGRRSIVDMISEMDNNLEAYCLIASLCGYMLIQPNLDLKPESLGPMELPAQSTLQLGRILLREAINARKHLDYVESPSIRSVVTSFFLFGSYFCLDLQGTAWFHLREATTLALTTGMHEESTYAQLDREGSSRRRRLYWLLFVTERAYALQQHRPLSLHATIDLPTLQADQVETELNGFLHLVSLFRPFDDTFVGLWNKARTGCSTEWLATLQKQLSDALPTYIQSTECQAVDLKVSQQWLRTMVWQLSISHGYLSSRAIEQSMSFHFPIEVSRELVSATSKFSHEAMETHGIGLLEKLFDISCTLADVISYVPYEQQFFDSYGPREYLHQLMSLISTLRGGQERYMPLLLSKINDTMPNAPGYALNSVATSSHEEEMYDRSEAAGSSSGSSGFGSPPLRVPEQQRSNTFNGFTADYAPALNANVSQSFAQPLATTNLDYLDLPLTTAPFQMFAEPLVFPEVSGHVSYDSSSDM